MIRRSLATALVLGLGVAVLLPGTANAELMFTEVGPCATDQECMVSKDADVIAGHYLVSPGGGSQCDHDATGYCHHTAEWQNG